MIYYITTRHQYNFKKIIEEAKNTEITILNTLDVLLNWLDKSNIIYFDKEFTNLNFINALPILTQIGDYDNQFVIDDLSFKSLNYLELYKEKLFVGHNIKIDLSISRKQGLNLRNVQDTMITEQRLGLDSKRKNDLSSSYTRRCKKEVLYDKSIGLEFVKMNNNSEIQFKHIFYSAMDVKYVAELHKAQIPYIKKYNFEKLLYEIEFPLIPIIVDMELEGFTINIEGWKKVVINNKKNLFNCELDLDRELIKLGFRNKTQLKIRKSESIVQFGLFSGTDRDINSGTFDKINYSSSKQVLQLFESKKLTLPTMIGKKVDKKTGIKTSELRNSLQIEALQAYNLNFPNNIFYNFINKLIEYKEIQKEISSFGEKFYNYKIYKKTIKKFICGYLNEITNKIHTVYRQCMTKTGRFSSGEADLGFYNSQQIPADKKYRSLFTLTQEEIDNDWWITTADLTGAEVVIMCAFAKDKQLYKWAIEEDDLHSPLATLCWKAIYNYRVNKYGKENHKKFIITSTSNNKETGKVEVTTLTEDFIINKKINNTFRTDFKSVGFGVIYGAGYKTIAKVLNIIPEEAKIVIKVIENTIPETFNMVKKASEFAVNRGFVIHNNRTNSLKRFVAAFKSAPSQEEIVAMTSEARNCRIQGTQADMIKEAIVNIYKYFKENNILNCPLLQVHDELVWKHKGKENGKHIARIMGKTATLYLEGFTKMKADYITSHTWEK